MGKDPEAERLRKSITRMLRAFKEDGTAKPDCPYAELNLSDLTVLNLVGENPGCIMRDVANALDSALSTATTVVDRLVTRDLVVRERRETNRRIVHLTLSENGEETYRLLVDRQRANCREVLDVLTPAEREAYLAIMDKISDAVQLRISSENE